MNRSAKAVRTRPVQPRQIAGLTLIELLFFTIALTVITSQTTHQD